MDINKRKLVFCEFFLCSIMCCSGLANIKSGLDRTDEILTEDLNVFTDSAGTLVHDYLLTQANEQFKIRRQMTEAALQSREGAAEYQTQVRKKYQELIGDLGSKTPLNPIVTGTIEADGYRIEKVAYQSRPHFYVTANLYVPATGTGPWPGVLVMSGHAYNAKAYDAYQQVSILLAKNGFVALIVDPLSQGERVQILDEEGRPAKKGGKYVAKQLAFEHSLIDYGSRLVGRTTVSYELWDNVRGIDYLLSRDEVDQTKPIGCTGNSGGGTQTTFLMAWDERIGPAAPSCSLATLESIFQDPKLQFADACQHLPSEGAAGFERADYLIMRAPKPTLVLAGTRDRSFNITSTRAIFAEAKRFYDVLECPDRLAMFEGDHGHGFEQPLRQEWTRWMRRWLLGDDSPVVEPKSTVQSYAALQVTQTGQVGSNWDDALLVPDLNLLRAKELVPARERFWNENTPAECQTQIKRLIGLRDADGKPTVEKVGVIRRKGYHIEKIKITREKELPIPGLLFVPDRIEGLRPAVLYVNGQSKTADAEVGGPIEDLVKHDYIVLAIDLRGTGETKNTLRYHYASYMFSDDYVNLMLSMHLGRPMLGQRVEEVLAALDVLAARDQVDAAAISMTGIGLAGPVVFHVAALDDRISAVTIRESITSWIDIIKAPLAAEVLPHVVPSVLEYYDIPDLVRAIAPRPVCIVEPLTLLKRHSLLSH